MIFKILSISVFLFTCIATIGGTNDSSNTDDEDFFTKYVNYSDCSLSPEKETFQEPLGTPAQQTNVETHEEASSSAATQYIPMDEKELEQWAQNIFLQEYENYTRIKKPWNDLRNKSYEDFWHILCFQLWDKKSQEQIGQECETFVLTVLNTPTMNHRVDFPPNLRIYADLLMCKCPNKASHRKVSNPDHYFFVTPCKTFKNSYFIMKLKKSSSLEVYDIRNATFEPRAASGNT